MENISGKEITILLLGETGVGKSTWINGFANFVEYESLDEAEQNKTICIIPASFTVADESYEPCLVVTGSDQNEVTETGQSATQLPTTYRFEQEGLTIRLIDTPGIGDVRGVEQDKLNFQMILDHISNLEHLDLICILLKPNHARLNLTFSFCIKELLTHLHKDAIQNLVFCFTNSRSTLYRPGDTISALKALLETNKDVEIPLNETTLYCMDNEAVRFLYATKKGIKFPQEDRKHYVTSWERSVTENRRLLNHASKQLPHPVKNTISLNNIRQMIMQLSNPMVDVTKNIQVNIAEKQAQKDEKLASKLSAEELSKGLFIVEYQTKRINLDKPKTICTALKCIEHVFVGGRYEIVYKTSCHANCGNGKKKNFDMVDKVGHEKLKKCSAFDKKGKCKHCGCGWEVHMKVTYETISRMQPNDEFEREMKRLENESAIQKLQQFLDRIDKNVEELVSEQQEITNASVQFARFLKLNSITPFNDSMDAYLELSINQAQTNMNKTDSKVVEGLKKMRLEYQQQMNLFETAMKSGKSNSMSSEFDFDDCVYRLFNLKHSGKQLMDMMNQAQISYSADYVEKRVEGGKSSDVKEETNAEKSGGARQKTSRLMANFAEAFRSHMKPTKIPDNPTDSILLNTVVDKNNESIIVNEASNIEVSNNTFDAKDRPVIAVQPITREIQENDEEKIPTPIPRKRTVYQTPDQVPETLTKIDKGPVAQMPKPETTIRDVSTVILLIIIAYLLYRLNFAN